MYIQQITMMLAKNQNSVKDHMHKFKDFISITNQVTEGKYLNQILDDLEVYKSNKKNVNIIIITYRWT